MANSDSPLRCCSPPTFFHINLSGKKEHPRTISDQGILSEVPRDANNNYRYYTQNYICEIVAAKTLKDIDMSLNTIKDVIHGENIDRDSCVFNGSVHNFKNCYTNFCAKHQPSFLRRDESLFRRINDTYWRPKNKRLYDTYQHLLKWAKQKGYQLEIWSVEEWLISPLIPDNKDLWGIQIMIPFKN